MLNMQILYRAQIHAGNNLWQLLLLVILVTYSWRSLFLMTALLILTTLYPPRKLPPDLWIMSLIIIWNFMPSTKSGMQLRLTGGLELVLLVWAMPLLK